MSVYSASTDCFYVLNDAQARQRSQRRPGDDTITVYLLGPQHDPRPEALGIADEEGIDRGTTIILQSPSTAGVLLHRILVQDRADEPVYARWYRENFSVRELDPERFAKPYAPVAGRCLREIQRRVAGWSGAPTAGEKQDEEEFL